MYRSFMLIMLVNSLTGIVSGQNGNLIVEGTAPNLNLSHTVAPKENWYSIGRLYNISPKEIAPFNQLTLENPLSIGQQIKVPLTSSNFSQDGSKLEDQVFVPVYHVVQDKEWMYRISTNYNKVAIESLEKWNSINKDQVKAGMQLIIGYLKVNKDQSALASKSTSTIKAGTPEVITPAVIKTVEKKPEAVAKQIIRHS